MQRLKCLCDYKDMQSFLYENEKMQKNVACVNIVFIDESCQKQGVTLRPFLLRSLSYEFPCLHTFSYSIGPSVWLAVRLATHCYGHKLSLIFSWKPDYGTLLFCNIKSLSYSPCGLNIVKSVGEVDLRHDICLTV